MTTSSERTKLNLGCGNYLLDDAVNHNLVKHRPEVDVVWDLNNLPWPWPDERFESVLARAVLEHLQIDLLTSINECWRIMKPGGKLSVKLPYWNAEASHNDLTHRHYVGLGIFDGLDPDTEYGRQYDFYTDRKFHITKVTLNNSKTSVWGWLTKLEKKSK